jgi:HPt (histidine-containing phosphotransfer) domain-containing protein
MEGDRETGPLLHNDSSLLFISETVSYILTKREAGESAAGNQPETRPPRPGAQSEPGSSGRTLPEGEEPFEPPGTAFPAAEAAPFTEEEPPVLEAVRAIEGLDVDRGLFLIGGSEEQYQDLLRISAKVFTDGAAKMRTLHREDLPAFAIEVHGMKGALYAIGADSLGDKAKELEFAAKAGDAAKCIEAYPAFEERFADLAQKLGAVVKRKTASLGAGSMPELIAALHSALEATRMFNSSQAGKVIAPLLDYSWEEIETDPPIAESGSPSILESLEKIADYLENIDYDEAEALISRLLKSLGAGA